jgi:hypothetical protein
MTLPRRGRSEHSIAGRRRRVAVGALLAAGLFLAPSGVRAAGLEEPAKKWAEAPAEAPAPGTREVPWLHFVHLYTGDVLPVYGETVPQSSFDHLMRCRATGKQTAMAPELPKLILAAAQALHGDVVQVLSGYRSEKFNEQLRKKGHEVASESFHTLGKAVDWRLRGLPLARLVAWLERKSRGGLGVYRRSNFVHTDVGPQRRWKGR